MSPTDPMPMICRYRVKPGRADEFQTILKRHWQTLHKAGLTTDEPAKIWRCQDKAGNAAFIEHFSWKTGASAGAAHQSPVVMALWEPMGALCDDMEFWGAMPIN